MNVKDTYIKGSFDVGGIVGNNESGTIKNCSFVGNVIGDEFYVGGIAGINAGGTIDGCSNGGSITGSSTGGIVGVNYNIVRNCYNTGSISGESIIGGIAGQSDGDTISCYNTGSISGDRHLGGIVGWSRGNVINCFNIGSIVGNDNVGGIVGFNEPGDSYDLEYCYNSGSVDGKQQVGGIAGYSKLNSRIQYCYNTGSINGISSVGSILGKFSEISSTTVSNCYYDKQMSQYKGVNGSDIGTEGKLTSEMTTADAFLGFNSDVWIFEDGLYPRLKSFDGIDAAILSVMPLSSIFTETADEVKTYIELNTYNGVQWTSSDTSIVSIDGSNAIIQGSGDVVLTATIGSVSKSINLSVSNEPPTLQSAVRNSDTKITVTLSEPCNNFTKANDGGFTVTETGTSNTFAVTAIEQGADQRHVVLTVENMRSAWEKGVTVTYTAGGNGTIADLSGTPMDTDIVGVVITPWPFEPSNSSQPARAITVAEVSCKLFENARGSIIIEADMKNAFSNSVDIKITDSNENAESFGLSDDYEIYPFDITIYIKGTDAKIQPALGYAVTFYLPVPEQLLGVKERLTIMHKSGNGTVSELATRLVQKNGVWYIVFDATEFSPYALVVGKDSTYDETMGVPCYIDANGNKVFISFAANGKYIAPKGITITVTKNTKNFTDIVNHWAKEYIDFVTEREIFLGTNEDKFSPDMGMTRAMFATIIGRLYERSYGEIASPSTMSFTDCQADAYYARYIVWASENGIISGYGDGKYGPYDLVTREQMAVILYRFAEFLGVLPNGIDTVLSYSDTDSISAYAKEAALYCQTTGIIKGRNENAFAPKETATRAEVAAIMQRFIEAVVK